MDNPIKKKKQLVTLICSFMVWRLSITVTQQGSVTEVVERRREEERWWHGHGYFFFFCDECVWEYSPLRLFAQHWKVKKLWSNLSAETGLMNIPVCVCVYEPQEKKKERVYSSNYLLHHFVLLRVTGSTWSRSQLTEGEGGVHPRSPARHPANTLTSHWLWIQCAKSHKRSHVTLKRIETKSEWRSWSVLQRIRRSVERLICVQL